MSSPSMTGSRCVAVAVALSLVALGGCGSDDDQASSEAPSAAPAATSAAPAGRRDVQADGWSIAVHVINANPATKKLSVETPPLDALPELVHRHGRTDRALTRGEKLVPQQGELKLQSIATQARTRFLFESRSGKPSVSSLQDLGGGNAPLAILTWDAKPAERTLKSLLSKPVDEVRVIEPPAN